MMAIMCVSYSQIGDQGWASNVQYEVALAGVGIPDEIVNGSGMTLVDKSIPQGEGFAEWFG